MTGFILFAHGSRVESANEAVRAVAARFSETGGYLAEPAFLELGSPGLDGAVESLANQGATRIIVIPYFLTLGTHLQRDLPRLLQQASAARPGIHIEATPPLDGHPALVSVLLDRATAALARNCE